MIQRIVNRKNELLKEKDFNFEEFVVNDVLNLDGVIYTITQRRKVSEKEDSGIEFVASTEQEIGQDFINRISFF